MKANVGGIQGWEQFFAARNDLLDQYDQAKQKSSSRKVKVDPGIVAEAAFRRWLGAFLPKRYGVTRGYIVSQGRWDDVPTPHYDVIIYDQLSAPVLWAEDNPDTADQGKSRAIPAEYVKSVLEVKSTLTPKHARDAIGKLRELEELLQRDDPEERFKKNIPAGFVCAAVFFELKKGQVRSYAALDALSPNPALKGYFGSLILRAEGADDVGVGKIQLVESDDDMGHLSIGNKQTLVQGLGFSRFHRAANGKYKGAMIDWTKANFSWFAFDLVAMLNGTFRMGYVSSFHALPLKRGTEQRS